ncbi:MAG: ABC transporter permease [Gemmataceae bacterium]
MFDPDINSPCRCDRFRGGVFLSALNVKYRDIKYILPFLIQVWLFATPVIYPLSMVPDRYRIFLAFNPMAGPIEALRSAILGSPINWTLLGMSTSVSSLILFFSYFFFSSSERRFADLI